MKKFKVLYLHGLASSSLSRTPKVLAQTYSDFLEVDAIDVYHYCDKSLSIISNYLDSHEVDAIIGTSLGGWLVLATKFNGIKIAINPVIRPLVDLNQPTMMGTQKYFQKRVDRSEKTYTMTIEDLQEYLDHDFHITDKTWIIQSDHDETLGDYREKGLSLLKDKSKHISTDLIGHRTTVEFLNSDMFKNLLNKIFER